MRLHKHLKKSAAAAFQPLKDDKMGLQGSFFCCGAVGGPFDRGLVDNGLGIRYKKGA